MHAENAARTEFAEGDAAEQPAKGGARPTHHADKRTAKAGEEAKRDKKEMTISEMK